MPLHNAEIVEIFNEVADLLEVEGANPFRIRAYRNAALPWARCRRAWRMWWRVATTCPSSRHWKRSGGKMGEIIRTGKLPVLENSMRALRRTSASCCASRGLGPKRVRILRDDLGIGCVAELKAAAEKKLIREHPGFGEKTEQKILAEIARLKGAEVRMISTDAHRTSDLDFMRLSRGGRAPIQVSGGHRRSLRAPGVSRCLGSIAMEIAPR